MKSNQSKETLLTQTKFKKLSYKEQAIYLRANGQARVGKTKEQRLEYFKSMLQNEKEYTQATRNEKATANENTALELKLQLEQHQNEVDQKEEELSEEEMEPERIDLKPLDEIHVGGFTFSRDARESFKRFRDYRYDQILRLERGGSTFWTCIRKNERKRLNESLTESQIQNLELQNLKPEDDVNPVYFRACVATKYKGVLIFHNQKTGFARADHIGNKFFVCRDEAMMNNGEPVYHPDRPVLDIEGNPVYDADGTPTIKKGTAIVFKQYLSFATWESFHRFLLNEESTERHYYEMFREGIRVKFVLDVDDWTGTETPREMSDKIIEHFTSFCKTLSINLTPKDFIILDSTSKDPTKKKRSLHIVVPAIVFNNINEHKLFYKKFEQHSGKFLPFGTKKIRILDNNVATQTIEGLDPSIYSQNRPFRTLLASKKGQNRPLKIADWNVNKNIKFVDTLITTQTEFKKCFDITEMREEMDAVDDKERKESHEKIMKEHGFYREAGTNGDIHILESMVKDFCELISTNKSQYNAFPDKEHGKIRYFTLFPIVCAIVSSIDRQHDGLELFKRIQNIYYGYISTALYYKVWKSKGARVNKNSYTILTLLNYLREHENYKAYKRILLPNSIPIIGSEQIKYDKKINQRRISTHDEHGGKVCDGVDCSYVKLIKTKRGLRTIIAKSAMGTGKTYELRKLLPSVKGMLIITFRRSLAKKYKNELGMALYEDLDGMIDMKEHPFVVCQIDSIHRIRNPVECVVLDEITYTFDHLLGCVDKGYKKRCFDVLTQYVRNSKYLIVSDALLTRTIQDFILRNREKDSTFSFLNTFRPYNETMVMVSKPRLEREMRVCLENHKKICLASNSRDYLKKLAALFSEFKILIITSETKTEDLDTVDWNQYQLVAYTPTITAGISYDDLYFDRRFGYFTNVSCLAESCAQMMFRVRHITDSINIVYIQSWPPKVQYPTTKCTIVEYFHKYFTGLSTTKQWDTIRQCEPLLTIDGWLNRLENDEYFKIVVDYTKRAHQTRNCLLGRFHYIMKEHGLNVITEKQHDENRHNLLDQFSQQQVEQYEYLESELYSTVADTLPLARRASVRACRIVNIMNNDSREIMSHKLNFYYDTDKIIELVDDYDKGKKTEFDCIDVIFRMLIIRNNSAEIAQKFEKYSFDIKFKEIQDYSAADIVTQGEYDELKRLRSRKTHDEKMRIAKYLYESVYQCDLEEEAEQIRKAVVKKEKTDHELETLEDTIDSLYKKIESRYAFAVWLDTSHIPVREMGKHFEFLMNDCDLSNQMVRARFNNNLEEYKKLDESNRQFHEQFSALINARRLFVFRLLQALGFSFFSNEYKELDIAVCAEYKKNNAGLYRLLYFERMGNNERQELDLMLSDAFGVGLVSMRKTRNKRKVHVCKVDMGNVLSMLKETSSRSGKYYKACLTGMLENSVINRKIELLEHKPKAYDRNEKIQCVCGVSYSNKNKARHFKTKRHTKFIQ